MKSPQYWLGELNEYGTASTVDGPHNDRAGVAQAKYLFDNLGFTKERRLVCMEIHVSEIVPDGSTVNHSALADCQQMGLKP